MEVENSVTLEPIPTRKLCVLATNPDPDSKELVWELAPEAHVYDVNAFDRVMTQVEQYRSMTGVLDRSGMNLAISLYILADRNGADVAKRIHLLEKAGAEFSWLEHQTPEEEEKEEKAIAKAVAKGKDPEEVKKPAKAKEPSKWLDLHCAIAGTTFMIGAHTERPAQAEIEFRRELHAKFDEANNTTKI